MQLLTELLVVLDNMECPCKLKNQCNKMKKEKGQTLCCYLWELDEEIFNKNNK